MDSPGAIVGGVAIGALGIGGFGGILMLLRYLKPHSKARGTLDGQVEARAEEKEEKNTVKIQIEEGIAYICVKSADLEEIKQLLFAFKKEYQVLMTNR